MLRTQPNQNMTWPPLCAHGIAMCPARRVERQLEGECVQGKIGIIFVDLAKGRAVVDCRAFGLAKEKTTASCDLYIGRADPFNRV